MIINSQNIAFRAASVVAVCVLIVSAASGGVGVAAAAADFTLDVRAPDSAAPGETVTISYTIENTGDTDLESLALSPTAETDGVTITNVSSDAAVAITNDNRILFETISPGREVTATVTVRIRQDAAGNQLISAEAENGFGSEAIARSTQTTITVDGNQGSGSGVSVSLEPASGSVSPEETITYELVIRNADEGVAAFETTVGLTNPSVASIVDAEIVPPTSFTDIDVREDRAVLATVGLSPEDTDEVVLARITVRGEADGTSELALTGENAYVNDSDQEYDVSLNNATVQVRDPGGPGSGLDVTGNGLPATDPDNDGQYEDIRGDGRFTVVDISALLQNRAAIGPSVASLFDFNSDGQFSVVDVSALLKQLPDT